MRRVLTAAALCATLLWICSGASAPIRAQQLAPAAAQGRSGKTAAKVIVSGQAYAGVRGLATDAAGNLYISLEANPPPAECVSRTASKASGAAKIAVTIFSNCSGAPEEEPSGIAVTSEGRVFLANRLQNRIRLLNMATGKVSVVPAAASKDAAQAATDNLQLFEPAGLALDETQALYAADRGNHRVLALAAGARKFTYLAHVLDAAAVAVDSARATLYVASPAANRIFEVKLISGDVTVFAGSGANADAGATAGTAQSPAAVAAASAAIVSPEGIAVDGDGNVFIAATGANEILRVDKKTGMLERVAQGTAFDSPGALTIDRRGNLFVADRGNARVVEFAGLAAPAPAGSVTISPAQLAFGAEPTGGTTPAQTFTLTNNSPLSLALSQASFSFTGANPNDFTQTNNCVPQVAPGGTCQIHVTFAPQATGARAAALTVTDADPSSPQTAQVSGTGDNYQITAASGSSTTQTVVPGKNGVFNLQITPDSTFSGTVTPACPLQLPAPSLACTVNPATVNVTAGQSAPFTVTISTQGPTVTAMTPLAALGKWIFPRGPMTPAGVAFFALLAAMAAILIFRARRENALRGMAATLERQKMRRRVRFAFAAFAVGAALAAAGCYGGSSAATNPNETPPGSYSIDISATAQNASRAITLTLNVD